MGRARKGVVDQVSGHSIYVSFSPDDENQVLMKCTLDGKYFSGYVSGLGEHGVMRMLGEEDGDFYRIYPMSELLEDCPIAWERINAND